MYQLAGKLSSLKNAPKNADKDLFIQVVVDDTDEELRTNGYRTVFENEKFAKQSLDIVKELEENISQLIGSLKVQNSYMQEIVMDYMDKYR